MYSVGVAVVERQDHLADVADARLGGLAPEAHGGLPRQPVRQERRRPGLLERLQARRQLARPDHDLRRRRQVTGRRPLRLAERGDGGGKCERDHETQARGKLLHERPPEPNTPRTSAGGCRAVRRRRALPVVGETKECYRLLQRWREDSGDRWRGRGR